MQSIICPNFIFIFLFQLPASYIGSMDYFLMAMRIPSFHSISRISEWLVTLSVGIIITSIITLILTSYENLQFLFVGGTDDALYEMDAVVGSISSTIEFIVIIIALYWFYRANQNIHSFGAKEISSPIMTIIWWFVPILQLWKPYKIAQQIWKASNPETGLSTGIEWKNLPSSNIIKLWWILGILPLLIVSIFVFYSILYLGMNYSDLEQAGQKLTESKEMLFYTNFGSILSSGLVIASTIFFIRLVKQISLWQEIKSGRSI